jgi:PAS domain S-box-containing protein
MPKLLANFSFSQLAHTFLWLFAAAVLASVSYVVSRDYSYRLQTQSERTNVSAMMFEDLSTQTLQLVENTIRTLPSVQKFPLKDGDLSDLNAALKRLLYNQPAIRSISLLSATEGIRASSNPANIGKTVALDAFYPPAASNRDRDTMRFGAAWQGHDFADGSPTSTQQPDTANQAFFVPLAMRLNSASTPTWILVTLNPHFLLNRISRYEGAEAQVFEMVRLDGSVLLSTEENVPAGAMYATPGILARVQSGEIGSDMGDWISAFRTSANYPFFVVVRTDRGLITKQWLSNSTGTVGAVLAGLLAIVLLTLQLMKRLKRTERSDLRKRRTILRMSQAMEQMPYGILITDTQGMIEYSNPNFSVLTGYSKQEMAGKTVQIMDAGRTPQQVYETQRSELAQGKLWTGEFELRHHDGHDYVASVALAPLLDERGRTTHHIAVFNDITARKQMQLDLELALKQAESANLARSKFLANMSHEVRTPMNGILGMTQLALDEVRTEPVQGYLRHARSAARAMLSMLNDILDFAKIEAGQLQVESVSVDLLELLGQAADMARSNAEKKGLTFDLQIDPATPKKISTDPLRLSQILRNLMSNAIKYTQAGRVSVRVMPVADSHADSEHMTVRFEVEDSGAGISPEKQAGMFRPFSNAFDSQKQALGSKGLGLAISGHLARMMGGTMQVRSTPNVGSVFTLDLEVPATQSQPDPDAHQASLDPGSNQDISALRLLVVEDDAINQQLMLAILSKVGIRPEIAVNGALALERLQASPDAFDLVLMDVQMPVMDGITATRVLRADARFAKLPIIAVTANAMAQDRDNCLRAGMQDYIAKPIDRETVYDTLRRWGLGKKNAKWQASSEPTPLPATSPASTATSSNTGHAVLDRDAAIKRFGGDAGLYQEIAQTFAHDKADAVEQIRQNLKAADTVGAQRAAHTLKGLAATIGANQLHEAAKSLDLALKKNDATQSWPALLDAVDAALQQALAYIAASARPQPE